MTTTLEQHIAEWSRRRFERGRSDCGSFTAAWIARLTGAAPASRYVGRRLTDPDARRMVHVNGGLLAMVASEMDRLGWRPVAEPEDGDVVVCSDRMSYSGACVGVWNRGHLVSMNEAGGVAAAKLRPLAAWRWGSAA